MITLQAVNVENFDEIISLSVSDEQREFVACNAESIAQAYVQEECIPLAIYDGPHPVGFVMYCVDRDDGAWWLYRLMVDRAHQGRGCGRAALEQVLTRMKADPARHHIYLGVEPENPAVSLYRSLGFRFDGRVYGRAHIMVLDY